MKINSFVFIVSIFFCNELVSANTQLHLINSIVEQMTQQEVATIDFMFTDILGKLHTVIVPLSHLSSALQHGLKFDGSSIPGCKAIFESDMHLNPDLNTAMIITETSGYKLGRVMCDVYSKEDMPYEGDPRSLLKRQLERAAKLGYIFNVGPELEFFLFKHTQDGSLNPIDSNGYFDAEICIANDQDRRDLLECLQNNGVNVEKLHHEVAPGQYEVSLAYADALTMADQIVLAKYTISWFAHSRQLKASFMPKPISNQNGSGMHVHFSLFNHIAQENAFYSADDSAHLSDTAHSFIAGVLNYIPEFNALINSTINSYKRLVAGYEAPVYICWATKNRSALIRIPEINSHQKSAARAELRSSDAMANPYILFTVLLAAGLDGIEQARLLAPSVNENLYKLTEEQIKEKGIKTLPANLSHALDLLERSTFASSLLGCSFINEFIHLKKREIIGFNRSISNWEIENYL